MAGGRTSRGADLFIAVFVMLQLLVPLTYYLRDDAYDERFGWRMFSGIRLFSCRTAASEVVLSEGEAERRPIELRREIHSAWIGMLQRNRRAVIDGFLRRRCERSGVSRVTVENLCRRADGSLHGRVRYELECPGEDP